MAVPGLSDARQVLTIEADAASGALMMLGMTGTERLGRLPEYRLDMVTSLAPITGTPEDIDLHALVGTKATVTLVIDSVTELKRHWHGYITHIRRGEAHGRYIRHTATLRPWPYFMTLRRNSKIFQKKTPKEILETVFGDYSGCTHEFRGVLPTYPKLDYCVQYDETDFNFVSRLMERFGLYYFFEHSDGSHKMVITDLNLVHLPKLNPLPVPWAGSLRQSGVITGWSKFEEARSHKSVIGDYDYLASTSPVKSEKSVSGGTAKVGPSELFEHSALTVQNSQESKATTFIPPVDPKGTAAKVVLDEAQSLQVAYSGITNVRDMACGATFLFANESVLADNGMYLLVETRYNMAFGDHEADETISKFGVKAEGFRCEFICVNSTSGSFKPERVTPRPRIAGPQTAVVVGASGNEIDTDPLGRIKVKFHWDRAPETDLNAGCWVRVAQPWAGKGFGFFALPRVGHEVVVSFIDGDPDKPLVTGSVYNDTNTMTWKMPDFATCTGIVTRSTKGGSAETYNELRFEDKKDSEYIWVRAQKDFYRHVKNDAFDFIEKNETIRVKETRNVSIGKDLQTFVGGLQKSEIVKDLHLTVGNDTLVSIKNVADAKIAKDFSAEVGGDWGVKVTGKLAFKVTGDIAVGTPSGGVDVKGGTIVLQGNQGIKLVSGAASITLGPGGVTIDGSMVKINCGGSGGSAKDASPKAPAEAQPESPGGSPDLQGPEGNQVRGSVQGSDDQEVGVAGTASAAAQPAQSYEQVKAALWNRDGARVIAVADGAVVPQLPQRLAGAATGGWDCLRRGQLEPDVAERSAYIAELERGAPFTDFLLKDATRDFPGWGLVMVARRSLMEVRNHCRALMEVLTPEGERRQWRWYDPEVLIQLLPSMAPSQLDTLFEPLHELVLLEARAWTWYQLENGLLSQRARPLLLGGG